MVVAWRQVSCINVSFAVHPKYRRVLYTAWSVDKQHIIYFIGEVLVMQNLLPALEILQAVLYLCILIICDYGMDPLFYCLGLALVLRDILRLAYREHGE